MLVESLYLLALVGLCVYGLNTYIMLALHWWHGRRRPATKTPEPPAVWPMVTVQLPVYNERYVARRVLGAVGAVDYPHDRLEIQLLDDSTDATTEILR